MADLQAQVLALVADPVAGDPVTANYPMYYAFANQIRKLVKRFGGGYGLNHAVYERYVCWQRRGMMAGWLTGIMRDIFGVQPEAQPAVLGVITPLNHATNVALAGTFSFAGGAGYRLAHFHLEKHSDHSVILDKWATGKSVTYAGLANATLYDLTITAYNAGNSRVSATDFTTVTS